MSMNAIAVLRIDPDVVRASLPQGGESPRIDALENATLVHLGMPLTAEPQALGLRLASLMGDVLALHQEARGVPVYPTSYELKAKTWDAAIAELGDGADWIPVLGTQPAMPDLSGMPDLASMLGAGGAGQMAALAEQLQSSGGADMMQQAMQMMEQLSQSGALAGLAEQMAGATTPEQALQQMGAGPDALGALGGLDLNAMAAQAQSMLAQNPDLERQMREQLGAAGIEVPGKGEDEGE